MSWSKSLFVQSNIFEMSRKMSSASYPSSLTASDLNVQASFQSTSNISHWASSRCWIFFVKSILTMPKIPYDPLENFEMCRNFFCWEVLEKIHFLYFFSVSSSASQITVWTAASGSLPLESSRPEPGGRSGGGGVSELLSLEAERVEAVASRRLAWAPFKSLGQELSSLFERGLRLHKAGTLRLCAVEVSRGDELNNILDKDYWCVLMARSRYLVG